MPALRANSRNSKAAPAGSVFGTFWIFAAPSLLAGRTLDTVYRAALYLYATEARRHPPFDADDLNPIFRG